DVSSTTYDDRLTLAPVPTRRSSDLNGGEIYIIGGGQIYSEALDLADTLHVTHVETEVEGDAFFPDISEESWQSVHEEEVPAGESDDFSTRYVIYRKRSAAKPSS